MTNVALIRDRRGIAPQLRLQIHDIDYRVPSAARHCQICLINNLTLNYRLIEETPIHPKFYIACSLFDIHSCRFPRPLCRHIDPEKRVVLGRGQDLLSSSWSSSYRARTIRVEREGGECRCSETTKC
jgi:hypothetical protein